MISRCSARHFGTPISGARSPRFREVSRSRSLAWLRVEGWGLGVWGSGLRVEGVNLAALSELEEEGLLARRVVRHV